MDKENKKYYLGLDIGTDSVGYAVTDEYYNLIRKKGEPLIGVHTFEAAATSADRRSFRTARRRLDRRQQRVQLVNELFAPEIARKDPRFFIRRKESALWRDETQDPYPVFDDPGFTDKEYYEKYPTIHHLICDLMTSTEPRDVRLVYNACAWLVAHRGHFLFDIASENVSELLDFNKAYKKFCDYFADNDMPLPWSSETPSEVIKSILSSKVGIKTKKALFKAEVYSNKKLNKSDTETCLYSQEAIIDFLSGSSVEPKKIFPSGSYTDIPNISLSMDEESFAQIVAELGDDGELLRRLRALQDCATLIGSIPSEASKNFISYSKVQDYNTHQYDLKKLKAFVKKYIPNEYNAIFRDVSKENYCAYSYNTKDCKGDIKPLDKKATQEVFCKFLKKKIDNLNVEECDLDFYRYMMARLDENAFLPKQATGDNRVIPQQLYRHELKVILDHAESYLPFLKKKDESGLTVKDKLLSVFDFRVPYYVGPLCTYKNHGWIVRKAEGKILPWNYKDKIDLDKSEDAFIHNMTGKCTYLAGEDILPEKSLLYSRFKVLNEINNLKINGTDIPVEVKQALYTDLFMEKRTVTLKMIRDYLKRKGLLFAEDEISGVDIRINNNLASYHDFHSLLSNGVLTEEDVEDIINRASYSEDRSRFLNWLEKEYPVLSAEDRKYIVRLNLKGFGRLSRTFLNGFYGATNDTGEASTIIEALWSTNNNLMQLLSDRFTFREKIDERNRNYYAEHTGRSLNDRLDEMYISNSAKRPIIRTLDICSDVVKAMGCPPEKIFVEMARGASSDQKGKRTLSRKAQLLELYKNKSIAREDARHLTEEIEKMGEKADNMLQSERLFLYYLQLGKSAYTGQPIDLTHLSDHYNREHIYPQSFVKDDSLLNNIVLVESEVNGQKSNEYPINAEIRRKMRTTWQYWLDAGLMTEEKFKRLTRSTPFTDEEKWGFINRQLVETRQSTKAVASILAERYPENTEIVYVKAGLVSEFRQEFDMLKSRQINNLHHAKDAYLNVVVGNVYNSRFSRNWFKISDNYTLNTKALFTKPVKCGKNTIWQGGEDLAKVRAVMGKNIIHTTPYQFCRKKGLFDQQIRKAEAGLIPLKKGMDTARYGGYRKPTASFFTLVKYTTAKKTDIMFMPVELEYAERFKADREFALEYAKKTISKIWNNSVLDAELLLNGRPIKINTLISADGLRLTVNGKSGGGKQLIVSLACPLILSQQEEAYIKRLEAFAAKKEMNQAILPNSDHDHITPDENLSLYDTLTRKMANKPYAKCPGNPAEVLENGRDKFTQLIINDQVSLLLSILFWFSTASSTIDLRSIGGKKEGASKYPSSALSSWSKNFKEIYVIDSDPSGIVESKSPNLLSYL